jgi:hypothetical protein
MATGWLSVIANAGLAVQPQSAVPQGAGRKVYGKVVFPGKHRNALGMIGVFVRYKKGFYILHRQLSAGPCASPPRGTKCLRRSVPLRYHYPHSNNCHCSPMPKPK